MNDNRINELVRKVMEVEELERSHAAPLRLAGESDLPRTRSWAWVYGGLGLAAAAAVALVAIFPVGPAVTPSNTGIPIANGSKPTDTDATIDTLPNNITGHVRLPQPDFVIRVEDDQSIRSMYRNATTRVDPGQVEACIVVAIYRDQVGAMHCVQLKPHEWRGNQCLNEVSSNELRSVEFGDPCTNEARQTLLVALSGPRRSLPTTEIGAVALAKCILGKPRTCDGEPACYSGLATQCVPSDVSVKVETVASLR